MAEFTSRDFYSGWTPEAQPWYSIPGLASPYGVYGINRAGLLAQQPGPYNSGGLNIEIDPAVLANAYETAAQSYRDQGLELPDELASLLSTEYTDRGLGGELPELGTSRLEDTTGIFAEIFGGMGRSDLLEANGDLIQRISELAAEGRPIAPADLELATLNREDAEAFVNAINEYNEGVILGDPGEVGSSDEFINIEYNEEGIPTDFVMDPSLIGLPRLLGDLLIEDAEGGGGATASPEAEGAPQPAESEAEQAIPDYSDLVNPEFEVPEAPEGVTGIPEFYRVDEDGNVTTILDPDNPIIVPPDRVPGHVDTTTPGIYPQSGRVIDEQEETTTPTIFGPGVVITVPPSSSTPTTPSDVVTQEPTGAETPSDNANTGTDQAGQEGQQGANTGGVGAGSAGSGGGGSGGNGTGDGGDGGMLSQNKFKFTPYTASVRGVNPRQVAVIGGQPQRQSIMGMFQEYLT